MFFFCGWMPESIYLVKVFCLAGLFFSWSHGQKELILLGIFFSSLCILAFLGYQLLHLQVWGVRDKKKPKELITMFLKSKIPHWCAFFSSTFQSSYICFIDSVHGFSCKQWKEQGKTELFHFLGTSLFYIMIHLTIFNGFQSIAFFILNEIQMVSISIIKRLVKCILTYFDITLKVCQICVIWCNFPLSLFQS